MKKIFSSLVMVLLMAGFAFGAACTDGSMAESTVAESEGGVVKIIQLDLLSKADGSITGTANCQFSLGQGKYVQKVEVWPDSAGTAPATIYNCRLNTTLGNDIMQGALQSLPITNTVSTGIYQPSIGGSPMPSLGHGAISVVCDTMGNAKGTTFEVHIYSDRSYR